MDRVDQTPVEISFSEECAMLMEAAVAFARDDVKAHPIRARVETKDGFPETTWKQMVDLGWPGLLVPEQFGGSGLALDAAVPIVEALGARLIASPLKSTILATLALKSARDSEVAREWLPRLANGAIGCVALADGNGWDWRRPTATAKRRGSGLVLAGEKRFAPFAARADIVLASVSLGGQATLVALPRASLAGRIVAETCTDATQRPGTIRLDGVEIEHANVLHGADVEHLAQVATVLEAVEMCGGAWGAIEYTIQYLKTRVQFGRLIGSYQALKHTIADAYLSYELLRSLVYAAASNTDGDASELLARMAKAKASELFLHVADRAVQFHGGFGFTYDCDAGFYLRRAMWSQSQFGNARHHRKRLAELLLDRNATLAM